MTAGVSVLAIRPSRSREEVDELLGDDSMAIVGSDRFSVYRHLPPRRRQVCRVHLQRTFEDFVARGGKAARVGQHLLEHTEQLFTWWHRVCDGTLAAVQFPDLCQRSAPSISFLLVVWAAAADAQTAVTCDNLLDLEPSRAGKMSSRRTTRLNRALRQQQHNVLDYFTMACHAALGNQPALSLLPRTNSAIR